MPCLRGRPRGLGRAEPDPRVPDLPAADPGAGNETGAGRVLRRRERPGRHLDPPDARNGSTARSLAAPGEPEEKPSSRGEMELQRFDLPVGGIPSAGGDVVQADDP